MYIIYNRYVYIYIYNIIYSALPLSRGSSQWGSISVTWAILTDFPSEAAVGKFLLIGRCTWGPKIVWINSDRTTPLFPYVTDVWALCNNLPFFVEASHMTVTTKFLWCQLSISNSIPKNISQSLRVVPFEILGGVDPFPQHTHFIFWRTPPPTFLIFHDPPSQICRFLDNGRPPPQHFHFLFPVCPPVRGSKK